MAYFSTFSTFRPTVLLGILCASLFLLSSCQEKEEPGPNNDDMNGSMEMDDSVDNQDLAPDFSLTSLSGSTVKLSDYDNKVVVLFFFGYSCPNCISSAPGIQKQINETFNSNDDFAILGLDQWNGNESGVQSFKNSTGVTFPLLMNASGTATAYSTTYDRLIVVNKSGIIEYKSNSSANSSINDVIDKINSLL